MLIRNMAASNLIILQQYHQDTDITFPSSVRLMAWELVVAFLIKGNLSTEESI